MRKTILPIILAAAAFTVSAQETASSEPNFKPIDDLEDIAFLKSNTFGLTDGNNAKATAEEQAALTFFEKAYPKAKVITPEDFMAIDPEHSPYTMIWIHADRPGLGSESRWETLAAYYTVPASDGSEGMTAHQFIDKLAALSKGDINDPDRVAVNLYLTGHATQFVNGIGRLDSTTPINVFSSQGNDNTMVDAPWTMSSIIEDEQHQQDPYHAGFAMYGHIYDGNWYVQVGFLVPATITQHDKGHDVYPILGPNGIKYDNNNCMWTNYNINDYNRVNNAQVHGTWGQNSYTVGDFGVVEFLPDAAAVVGNATKRDWVGNIIVNGIGGFQWAPEAAGTAVAIVELADEPEADDATEGDTDETDEADDTIRNANEYAYNLRNMTFNNINYLSKVLDRKDFLTGIRDIFNEPAADAEADTEAPAVFYTLSGAKVSGTPSAGLYIRVQGSRASKVLVK